MDLENIPEHIALRAFVQCYADTAYLAGEYRRDVTPTRSGAGDVAAAVMHIPKGQLFRMMGDVGDPPKLLTQRAAWVEQTVTMLWGAVRWPVEVEVRV